MNDTLMYVFNFEDNQGFSVVSANRNTDPLIAVTESGYYDPDSLSEIEGFNLFMDMAKEYIRNPTDSIMLRLDPIINQKDSVVYSHSYVGPYISVMWVQTHPAGEFCPNGVAGCGNLAIAQMMSYYESPTSIALTYENADKQTQTLNWTNIKSSHLRGDSTFSCIDTISHNSIARLCRQLGELTQSVYHPATDSTQAGTSTNKKKVKLTLLGLGWNTGNWTPYSESNVINALDGQHPLFVTGIWIKNNGTRPAHMWIVDGYDDLITTTYYYEQSLGSNEWELVYSTTETGKLYHINWGWNGWYNGYYAANVFNVPSVRFPDLPSIGYPRNNNYTENITTMVSYPN